MKKVLVPLALTLESPNAPQPIHFARETYIQKLVAHGLTPIFISPVMSEAMIDSLYAETGGLLLMGGSDINPELYAASKHAKTEPGDIRRDQCEIRLVRKAIADRKPILGICRGHQILVVATGGTLIQHIPDVYPTENHADVQSYYDMLKPEHGHPITIVPGTKVTNLIGTSDIVVTSAHHQAAGTIGPDFRVAGTSPAGVIEIIEHTDPDYFCFGVQSHPECCTKESSARMGKEKLEIFLSAFAAAVR